MKKVCYAGVFAWLFLLLTACQNDMPEPETKKIAHGQEAVMETAGVMIEAINSFTVKHQVKGSDVYLECMVKGASFRNDGATIILYIDGKRTKEIDHAAFIVKGLNKGKHKIKLELLSGKRGLIAEKEVEIDIK